MQKLIIPGDKKILIIAPHPDDEIFCCSGILMNYEKQCDVILLTYGEKGNPGWSKRRTAEVRKEEFRRVMDCFNIHNCIELKLPDGKVKEKVSVLRKIPYGKYDYIFLPNRYDLHKDHGCVYSAVNREIHKKRLKVKLFEYEMWGMLRKPSHYIDITNKIDRKKELMTLYKSQEMYVDYYGRILALNYFRAIGAPPADYIECFYTKPEKTKFILWPWINKAVDFIFDKE